jgi:hypothetical protein
MCRGHGFSCNLIFTFKENHEEDKFLGLVNYLPTFLNRDEINGGRWSYLWYNVKLSTQRNNTTVRYKLIYNMLFPQIWLAQNKIVNFKGGNITQYLILEGIDVVGNMTLLADENISSLIEPLDGLGLKVWCCSKVQPPNDLY